MNMPPSYIRKQINVCRICKINFIVLISRLYSGTSITSFTYNDPCLLVKAGRVFIPKIQRYHISINIKRVCHKSR